MKTPLLDLADHYYAVAHDLMMQGERALETARWLGTIADRMCEENVRETSPKPEPTPDPTDATSPSPKPGAP